MDSSATRVRRRGHRRRLVITAIVAGLLAATAVALVATSANRATSRGVACSPAPCADDGGGLQVHVEAVRTLGPGSTPGVATVTVEQVSLRFTNTSQSARPVDALDFSLRDNGGTVHGVMQVAGPPCGIFEARQLGPGLTLGPKVLCFAVPATAKTGLTLVWSPTSSSIDISLPSA